MQKLIKAAGLNITLKTPKDIGVDLHVEEDAPTLAQNAEKKARTLVEHTNLPVLADDTGFFIEGEEIDPKMVKRNALGGEDEQKFTLGGDSSEDAGILSGHCPQARRQSGRRVEKCIVHDYARGKWPCIPRVYGRSS